MLKKVLFVAVVSAFVVACGSSNTPTGATPATDSSMKTADTAIAAPAADTAMAAPAKAK